ncbi:hypothetical protein LRH25_20810 [Ideonella azotifigens]|uniref:Uncharacterized protein n=1 Tax=Ideonella azotifigens TaxID=513160 RepID=A0ABP3V8P8_9BURK|nr:hypothetical protein [Ideonella azotifigens]MCD2342774.1 hypothetical protein [Ideonella azotifigens]
MEPSHLYLLTVSVTTATDGSGSEQGNVEPHDAAIKKDNTLMVYTLTTEGYEFCPDDPLLFDTPSGQFPYQPWLLSATELALFNKATKKGDHPYHVYVRKVGTTDRLPIDPMIQNEGKP